MQFMHIFIHHHNNDR